MCDTPQGTLPVYPSFLSRTKRLVSKLYGWTSPTQYTQKIMYSPSQYVADQLYYGGSWSEPLSYLYDSLVNKPC